MSEASWNAALRPAESMRLSRPAEMRLLRPAEMQLLRPAEMRLPRPAEMWLSEASRLDVPWAQVGSWNGVWLSPKAAGSWVPYVRGPLGCLRVPWRCSGWGHMVGPCLLDANGIPNKPIPLSGLAYWRTCPSHNGIITSLKACPSFAVEKELLRITF
jgi:hypothetical protein